MTTSTSFRTINFTEFLCWLFFARRLILVLDRLLNCCRPEFLGALAVVGSLVYLAIQIKQARQMFATGAQQQIGDAFQQILRDIW
jgi:hypothetical protein